MVEMACPVSKREENGKRTMTWWSFVTVLLFLFFMDKAYFLALVKDGGQGVFPACPLPDRILENRPESSPSVLLWDYYTRK